MTDTFLTSPEYHHFIDTIKQQILQARYSAIRTVNIHLISLYYEIWKHITLKQQETQRGDKLITQVEKDLRLAFPDTKGFSRSNLFYMKKMYLFFGQEQIVPQSVGLIPRGHIRLLLDKVNNRSEAEFYITKTMENGRSRAILDHQIDSQLFQRSPNITNNFALTVENTDITPLQDSFKDRYVLDFLDLSEQAKEKDLEEALIKNITQFLIELWKGFAFVWKQYKLTVGNKEFYIDLLFYHYILKRFIVIELKTTEFKPEHIGQLGFYMTAVDQQVKIDEDNATIGLIICKTKDKTVVEYALNTSNQPMGVAEYVFSQLPAEFAKYLPDSDDLTMIME